jgi:nitrite reductase/ring-hydroxylating ferredoxin subunit
MTEIYVCKVGELDEGGVRIVEGSGKEIGVIQHGGEYFAYRNVCPHQGGPVCEGLTKPKVMDIIDDAGLFVGQNFNNDEMHIVCPWHGYEYRIESGENVCNPAIKLEKFEVLTRDGAIYVQL